MENEIQIDYEKKVSISNKTKELYDLINELLPDGRYKALAITELEKVEIWSVKALTK